MTDEKQRVRFDNDLPGRKLADDDPDGPAGSDPLEADLARARRAAPTPDGPAAAVSASAQQAIPNPPTMLDMPEGLELTPDQRAKVLAGLYEPTVNRMCTLVRHVVNIGQNGDMVVWLPMSTMLAMFNDLRWDRATPDAAEKLTLLMVTVNRRIADRMTDYLKELSAWRAAGAAPAQMPAPPKWSENDANECYEAVSRTYERAVDRFQHEAALAETEGEG